MLNNDLYFIKRTRNYPKFSDSEIESAFIPVSMNNGHFRNKNSIREMLDWVEERTSNVTFLIGDFLHRNNLIFLENLEESEAISKSLEMGNERINLIKEVSHAYDLKITFIRTEIFYRKNGFDIKMSELTSKLRSNQCFNSLIDKATSAFLNRQENNIQSINDARSLCRKYLLEEIIIFESIALQGYKTSVYPGKQLEIMKEIVRGNLVISEPIAGLKLVELVLLKQ